MNEFVYVEVEGKNVLLFIRRIINNNIKYDKYSLINKNKLRLRITYDDYISLISKKSIYKITVIKYYGFLKIKYLFLKYKDYFLSSIIGLLMIIILSNITFKIDIIHNDKDVRQLIKNELKNNNIKELYKTPSYKKRLLVKKRILKENKDKIEWLEIEVKGSKIIVKVTERRINKIEKELHPRHIVAKKSAILKKIVAEDGMILKKKNDYVEKGETVISGDILKDEEVKKSVVANGKIYGEVWYKVKVSYPLYYKETVYLSNVKSNAILKFFSKKNKLLKDYSEINDKSYLYKENLLPISLYISKSRKTKTIKQKLNNSKAISKALFLAAKKINNTLDKDEYIIDKKALNFHSNSSTIEVDVFFRVYENITSYKDTEDIKEKSE